MVQEQKRFPRPSGLTILAQSLHKAGSAQERSKLKVDILKKVVGDYVNNGFTFMGKSVGITDLAYFTQVTPNRVMKEISRYSKTLASIANPEETQQTLQAMVGLLLQNVITDRGKIQKQADMLVAAQEGGYKAFVSKEANSALKNLIDSNKPLIDLLKTLQGPGSTFIQNNVNGDKEGPEVAEDAITIDSAIALLNSEQPGSLLERKGQQQKLLESELGSDTPEVVAIKQKNFELQGQFAAAGKAEVPKIKVNHNNRNETDGEITDGITDITFENLDE